MRNENESQPSIEWEAFESYLAGELRGTTPEGNSVRKLLGEVPGSERLFKNQGLFDGDLDSGEMASERVSKVEYKSVDASWDDLKSRIASPIASPSVYNHATIKSPPLVQTNRPFKAGTAGIGGRTKFAVRFAAVAALVAFAWFAGAGKVRSDLATYASVYSTQPGRQAAVTLPDGTDVILNVGSRLEVGSDFETSHRTVKLTGQARFNVKHQTGKPFLVETASGTVTVLGTEFVVRDYEWDSVKTVSVWEGRVGFGADIISAGEQITVVSNGNGLHSASKSVLDTTSNSFVNGVLTVNSKKLEDIIPELATWYAVDIKFGDAGVRDLLISGRFRIGAVSELIEVLAWTLDVRAERNGDQITLYSK